MNASSFRALLAIAVSIVACGSPQHVAAQATPTFRNVATVLGTVYCVDQDFLPTLDSRVSTLRGTIRTERAKGNFIGYISVPLSATGGGNSDINRRASAEVKSHLEKEYGQRLWMLAPGAEEATIPPVNNKQARGQEYMYMWTQLLAGEDGKGRDFDLFYFVGPSDFWRLLGVTASTSIKVFEDLADKAGLTGDQKRNFVSYYAFRASATASRGAHDEWNILQAINSARRADNSSFGIGVQVASFFDGRPVELDDIESSVSPGYEGICR